MQDQIAPLEAPEEEAGGGEVVVHRTIVDNVDAAKAGATGRTGITATVSIPPRWTIATVPC